MKSNKLKTKIKKAFKKAIEKTISKDPSSLAKQQVDGSIQIKNVVAKKTKHGINIMVDGQVRFSELHNPLAVQGIINRLVANKRKSEIPTILRLDKEYVKYKVDLLHYKHYMNNPQGTWQEQEIREHRALCVSQLIEDIDKKLYTYKNI